MFHHITAVVKNFLRNGKTQNCIDSLLRWYPGIKIMVVDDSYEDYREKIKPYYKELIKKGHKVIYTPFDLGISFGRNLAIENIETQYVLIGDNDFVYNEHSGVDRMKKVLDDISDLDVICGGITENGVDLHYEGFMQRLKDGAGVYYLRNTALDHNKCEWKNVGTNQYAMVDLGFNYFLMRRSAYPRMSWAPEIKVSLEHTFGMFRAKKNGIRMAYLRNAFVTNDASTEGMHEDYPKFRKRFVGWDVFCRELEVEYGIDFDGARGDYKLYGN